MSDEGSGVQRERELVKRWINNLEKHERQEHEIRGDISDVNQSLDRLRDERKKVRAHDREGKGEQIADHIDELEGIKNDLLVDLADKKDRSSEAEKILSEHRSRLEAGRKKREARQKARVGNGDLSPHFSIGEFACHDGTPVPDYMRSSLEALCRDHLEPMRTALGGPIRVNSGFRTASYNASIGGATASYHIYTLRKTHPACDHVSGSASPGTVQSWYDNHTNPDGMGYYSGFTHIDDRGYRSRWSGIA